MQRFHDRYPLLGPLLWLLSLQYYVTQLTVASYWSQPYSWLTNTISDLGNTVCGLYGQSFVCTPAHDVMNASFIVLGITMAFGASLLYREFPASRASYAGFSGLALAGIGTGLVGLFPENTVAALHVFGAALPFLIGNAALLILGFVLDMTRLMRIYTIASGVITLVALPLFLNHYYFGLGIGGMERVVAYPQTIWLMVFAGYIMRSHYQNRPKP